MNFSFEGKVVLKLEHTPGDKTSKHLSTDFNLDVSDNLDRKQYLDENDLPSAIGSKALTHCFVQGLVGNIHAAHQKVFWNDVEHLRYIISELEQGLIQITEVKQSNFKNSK